MIESKQPFDPLEAQMRNIAAKEVLAQTVAIGQQNSSVGLEKIFLKELEVGSIIQNYEILDVLGAGGFGVTYLAQDTFLGRYVVLKENFPSHCAHRDPLSGCIIPNNAFDLPHYNWALKSFINEARTIAGLSHPNIVRVLSIFESNDTAYFAMDYIEGLSLDYLAGKNKLDGKTYSEAELIKILFDSLSVLSYVHAHGIIHKDIKPGNILITRNGDLNLIDFGAAREVSNKAITTVMASHGFSSPEQSLGIARLTPSCDLYSLGATMFFLLTGRAPQRAEARFMKDDELGLSNNPELKKHYSQSFLKTIDKALSPKVEKRYASADEWLEELPSCTGVPLSISIEAMTVAGLYVRRGSQNRNRRRYNAPTTSSRTILKADKKQVKVIYGGYVALALAVSILAGYYFTNVGSIISKDTPDSPLPKQAKVIKPINLNKIKIGGFSFSDEVPRKTIKATEFAFKLSDVYIVTSEPVLPSTKKAYLSTIRLTSGALHKELDSTANSIDLYLEIYDAKGKKIARSHNKVPTNIIADKTDFTYNFTQSPLLSTDQPYFLKFTKLDSTPVPVTLAVLHNELGEGTRELYVPYARYVASPEQAPSPILDTALAKEILLNLEVVDSSGRINISSISQTSESAPILELYARRGYAWAMYILSEMYEKGQGVTSSPSLSYLWLYRAAESGCVDAQILLSSMHAVVRVSYPKLPALPDEVAFVPTIAFKFCRAAAQQRDPASMFILGVRYAQGWGCPQSASMAQKLFKRVSTYTEQFTADSVHEDATYLTYWSPYFIPPYQSVPIICTLKDVDLKQFKGIRLVNITNNIIASFSKIRLVYEGKIIAEETKTYDLDGTSPTPDIYLHIPAEYLTVDPGEIELILDAKSRGDSYGLIEVLK